MVQKDRSTRLVANWVLIGIIMLIIQVLLGGITRLTGSGLSITEWKPIMGAFPPMNDAEWNKAFEQYKQIAQYKYLNQHFTLSDFKFIFFWEWFHRLWARIIGFVFLIPFIYFIVKKHFKQWMILPLVILFLLGALQGAVGWIMVQSGLNENDLYVSHIRLAAHFIAAMGLIAYALVFWLKLIAGEKEIVVHSGLKTSAIIILAVTVVQLTYGAFMAGLKAATFAPTWPDINGTYIPESLFTKGSWAQDIIHNPITIHFIHRNLAYAIAVLVITWWFKARKSDTSKIYKIGRNLLPVFILVQVLLGILAVLYSPEKSGGKFGIFEWFAQLHQLVGMLLFLNIVAIVYLTRYKKQ